MYYDKSGKDDLETITKLQEMAGSYPTEGQDLYYGQNSKGGVSMEL